MCPPGFGHEGDGWRGEVAAAADGCNMQNDSGNAGPEPTRQTTRLPSHEWPRVGALARRERERHRTTNCAVPQSIVCARRPIRRT